MDSAIGGASADGQQQQSLWREAIDPFAGGNRLPGRRIVTETRPASLFLYLLVGNRSLDNEHERIDFSAYGPKEPFDEIIIAADRAGVGRY